MVKYIASINNYTLSLDTSGILNVRGIKPDQIEDSVSSTGMNGQYLTANGSKGWSWTTPTPTSSVNKLDDLTDVTTTNDSIYLGSNSGHSATGTNNTFIGIDSGASTNSGTGCVFIGYQSGYLHTSGVHNVFVGESSGRNNATGNANTFIGYHTGYSNTTGSLNTFIGNRAGYNNTTANYNTFIGQSAGYNNTTESYNTFIGNRAGYNNTTGTSNTFIGQNAGYYSTANYNTFIGQTAGLYNTTGENNTFIGTSAGLYNTTGSFNTYIGKNAGGQNNEGNQNTFIGYNSGYLGNTANTYSDCVVIGYYAQVSSNSGTTNEIVIGSNAVGNGSHTITLGNNSTTELHIPGLQVGAQNGHVLMFDGTKINLSQLPVNSVTVVEPFSVSSIGGLFTMTSLTGYYTMFHNYIDVEFSRISLYTMSDTSGATGTIVAGIFSNSNFTPTNTPLSHNIKSFNSVSGVTEIIIDFNTVQLSPHSKYWLGISVQITGGTLYLAKSAIGSTDNYFALSDTGAFNGTTLSAPVSPSPSSFNFYYRLYKS